jgi:flagellar hook protein FlgE
MSGAFFIGLSGLTANSTGIKNVGNNLANTNTIGYKASNLFFEEVRSALEGAEGGQGVGVSSTQETWTQGNIQHSQIPTDMAIRGHGFFVVSDSVNSQYYTRAGNFEINRDGKLVTAGGLFVMGYPVVDGEIDPNAELTTIDMTPGQILAPRATEEIHFVTNLNSETPSETVNPEAASFSSSTLVYDSLGAAHSLTATFTKTDTGWRYEMSVPAIDVGGTSTDPPTVVDSGTLAFDADGKLTSPATDVQNITIAGLANGASDIVFQWTLYDEQGEGLLTQFDLPNSTSKTFQDGNGAGTLTDVFVLEDGTIEGLYSNGETGPLGQVVLSSFTSPQGLVRVGDNLYARTTQSGEPTIGMAATGGRGRIQGSAIEMSNVDIAEEFIQMIIFQRGYQANSRVITTSDQITLEALQLKQ